MLTGRFAPALATVGALVVALSRARTAQLHSPFGQAPGLPPVPAVHGPLAIRVVYPTAADRVEVSDSSFIFGSVGDGAATLTINGQPAAVAPNGGFLAWVAFPPGSPVRFTLVARRGGETASAELVVERTGPFHPADPGRPWIDSTSLEPRGRAWWPATEPLVLEARAAAGARLELVLPTGKRVPFAVVPGPEPVPDAVRAFEWDPAKLHRPKIGDRYRAVVRGLAVGERLPAMLPARSPRPARPVSRRPAARRRPVPLRRTLRLEAIEGRDTARVVWPLDLALLDSFPPAARLDDDPDARGGTDGITVGRARPGATYHWFFPAGTVARVTGRLGDEVRLELSHESSAWVAAADVEPAPAAVAAGLATVGSITMTPGADRITVRIPVTRRVPYFVDEDDRSVRVTLYGATGDVNWLRYGPADSAIRLAAWRQRAADEVDLEFRPAGPLVGYRARWDGNDLLLEIRRPPVIDPGRPLAGRLIVIDPGHPPAGSTGPTGLTESEANLAVSRALVPLLEGAGARVLLTRTDARPIDLWPRVRFADSVNADLLVSIHNNALPDGLNPRVNSGSSTFYFQPPSLPLARRIQRRLIEELGQRDLGVARADLALARPTWMPAVLVEGLFMMLPEHEAALRSPEGQRRYARAVFRGIEDYFAAMAGRR